MRGMTERQHEAYQLWLAGLSYRAIGKQMGCTESRAYELVKRAKEVRADLADDDLRSEKLRDLDRIDRLIQTLMPRALSGVLAAAAELRQLLALRARVVGYEQVTFKHEGTVYTVDALDAEIARLTQQHADAS